MTAQRTPGPWFHENSVVYGPDANRVVQPGYYDGKYARSGDEHRANAAFIVEACNAHDGLIAQRDQLADVATAATVFLAAIDNMTSEEFSRGADKVPREALRSALRSALRATEDGS